MTTSRYQGNYQLLLLLLLLSKGIDGVSEIFIKGTVGVSEVFIKGTVGVSEIFHLNLILNILLV